MPITHSKVVVTPDDGTSEVGSNEWNADHVGGVALGTATPLVESGAGVAGTAAAGSHEDHVHPGAFATATPALTLGTTNAQGVATTSLQTDATILAFDATAPVTQIAGDAAAVGSATVAARRDHKHGMPAANPDGNALVGGETLPRLAVFNQGAATIATGTLSLGYFTALTAAVCTKVVTYTGNAAAGATPTLCRVGLYTVAGNGDLALVASTPNTTSLWASTFTAYFTNLSANYTLIVGQRYALGLLIVTGAAVPTFWGGNVPVASDLAPKLWGGVGSQSNLAASYTAAQVTWQANSALLWAAITP